VYYGTDIPKSFELAAEGGNFWVHPNATEHMAEYFTRNGSSYSTSVETQSMLTSFRQAVNQAISQGIEYGQIMHVGDWELAFSQGHVDDVLPVIKHALRK
jgi:O6-methylguanine-DNA--protein-cysteine methyltransferase